MTETSVNRQAPGFEEVFALLEGLVGTRIDPDRPLSTSAIESLDVVEWVFLIEENMGLDVADLTMRGAGAFDLEVTPRDVYNWIFS